MVDLQYCVNFRCTAKWVSYAYTYIHFLKTRFPYTSLFSRSVVSDSLWPHGLCSARLLCPWDSPGKNTGGGFHFLLQYTLLQSRIPCAIQQILISCLFYVVVCIKGFPGGSVVKNLPANAGDAGATPELGRSLEKENGNPLQYSAWETPWTEEPGGLQSVGWQRVKTELSNWTTNVYMSILT